MKKYKVTSAKSYFDIFQNYLGDYIVAETKEEAIEFYKQWLLENGMEEEEIEELVHKVEEYGVF